MQIVSIPNSARLISMPVVIDPKVNEGKLNTKKRK